MNQELQQETVQEITPGPEVPEAAEQQSETSLPQVGTLLIEARERINLSAADLARQLRLALRQVQALEENRFDDLPGNTFVRGFIRNYARAVQAEAGPLLAAYERSRPQPAQVEMARPSEAIAFPSKGTPKWVWYVGSVVLVLLLAPIVIYLVLQDDGSATLPPKAAPIAVPPSAPVNTQAPLDLPMPQAIPQNTESQQSAAPAQASESNPVLLPPATNPSPAAAPAPIVPPAAPQGATSPVPTPANPAVTTSPFTPPSNTKEAPKETALKPGEARVAMSFEGDAWVEMRDRSGKIVFSRLSRRGEVQVVQGKPPFNVVVGNAGQVRFTYNDKPFDLAPHTKVNVARFNLE